MAFNFVSQLKNCDDSIKYKLHTEGLDAVRYNESIVYLEGDYEIEENIENLFSINLQIAKLLPGGGTEIVVTYEMTDFCSELEKAKTSNSSFTSTANSMGVPNKCPVPPGTYTVDKLICDPVLMKSLKEGDYNMKLEFTKHDASNQEPGINSKVLPDPFGCVSVPLVVEPAE